MTQIESLAIAIKYLEDNGFNVENQEEILDNLTNILCEKIRESSQETNASREIDNFNRIVSHPEVYITQTLATGCSAELTKDCLMKCDKCTCKECHKRFSCDGGNPLTGCGE